MKRLILVGLLAAALAAPACSRKTDGTTPPDRGSPSAGKPFKAELTRLDGSKLVLPDDLKGKVVLVDFWATWCPPCVASVPELKRLYGKYHGQGLEIVGISLDEDRSALERFIKDRDLAWIHTFSGMQWADPTAKDHGVDSIPNTWLVGRDGMIITDQAEQRLEESIADALKAPARHAH